MELDVEFNVQVPVPVAMMSEFGVCCSHESPNAEEPVQSGIKFATPALEVVIEPADAQVTVPVAEIETAAVPPAQLEPPYVVSVPLDPNKPNALATLGTTNCVVVPSRMLVELIVSLMFEDALPPTKNRCVLSAAFALSVSKSSPLFYAPFSINASKTFSAPILYPVTADEYAELLRPIPMKPVPAVEVA